MKHIKELSVGKAAMLDDLTSALAGCKENILDAIKGTGGEEETT